jgi:phospholipid/cholesterol/gamma-HCH transport system substrate-binding protein
LENLDRASVNSNRTLVELNKFASGLNQEGTLFYDLTHDKEIYKSLQSSVDDLQATAESAKTLTDNLNEASNKLNDKNNTAGMILNDEEFAERIKHTMIYVDSSTMNLNRGLEALEYTWPFRKGFKKMEKAKENE